MSHTLILRLAGPMQSWGVNSRFSIRETLTEPSKSGVVGLLCAALGWDRSASTHFIAGRHRALEELANLPFAVRVLREGTIRRDYHTAQHVLRAKAKIRPGRPLPEGDLQETVLSERYYLSDAHFLVGLQSDDRLLLEALDTALARPHWQLCLGRKSFVPSWPVRFTTGTTPGVVPLPLSKALINAHDPVFAPVSGPKQNTKSGNPGSEGRVTRFITDKPVSDVLDLYGYRLTMIRRTQRSDVPLSFHPRRFAPRKVTIYSLSAYVPIQTDTESPLPGGAS